MQPIKFVGVCDGGGGGGGLDTFALISYVELRIGF